MSEFLDNLKVRLIESQKRFNAKQQQLAALNAEFQAVAQEFNAWQTLVNLETQKEQAAARTTATANMSPQVTTGGTPMSPPPTAEVNKTEIVRELLRQHSSGMTPSEIWKQVRNQVSHRPYLYSVLKRLKDKGDVSEKRGKYFFKFAPKADDKEQDLVQ